MSHAAADSSLASVTSNSVTTGRRLELRGDTLYLEGSPVIIDFGRRGFFVGCTFVTYEAFDKLVQMESAAK